MLLLGSATSFRTVFFMTARLRRLIALRSLSVAAITMRHVLWSAHATAKHVAQFFDLTGEVLHLSAQFVIASALLRAVIRVSAMSAAAVFTTLLIRVTTRG